MRIVDTEDNIYVMTNKILRNRAFAPSVARFVKHNIQKVVSELKASTTMNKIMKTGSGNNGKRLVAVSPQQKSTSLAPPSPKTF